MTISTANLTTKERNIQRSSTAYGFRMALMPMLQIKLISGDLESALNDPVISSIIKQAEDLTGFAIRITQNTEGSLVWQELDLTEDSLFSVQMSRKQAMRATLGGVQLEITIAQKTDKGMDVIDRDSALYAIKRLGDILAKLPSPLLHVDALEDGKRYAWDLSGQSADAPSQDFDPVGQTTGDSADISIDNTKESIVSELHLAQLDPINDNQSDLLCAE